MLPYGRTGRMSHAQKFLTYGMNVICDEMTGFGAFGPLRANAPSLSLKSTLLLRWGIGSNDHYYFGSYF
jgi:hypothetical protein